MTNAILLAMVYKVPDAPWQIKEIFKVADATFYH
jgi:hypothetical protein